MSIEQMASLKKITAGFAVFGFVLSFITGIISGVLFGSLLLRALLFAVLFGGMGFAATRLSIRFIPELFSEPSEDFNDMEEPSIDEAADSDSAQDEKISGENLDITVEDEPDDDSESAETVEEAEELEPAENAAQQDEDVEDVEELEQAPEEPLSEDKDSTVNRKGTSDGSLPDIGEFNDSFERSESDNSDNSDNSDDRDNSEVSSGLSSIDGAGGKGVELMGEMHDTQEITRAVQTILKRDQEG